LKKEVIVASSKQSCLLALDARTIKRVQTGQCDRRHVGTQAIGGAGCSGRGVSRLQAGRKAVAGSTISRQQNGYIRLYATR
jgi:hypothetical protein